MVCLGPYLVTASCALYLIHNVIIIMGSGKHLQDNQKAKRLDFTTHQVGSSKHLLEPS